jgi:hypothetical protein
MPVFLLCLPCLSLIIYFLIIGIFFPSKRKFIKDAIQCFWKKFKGEYCSDAFDLLVHKQFVMWLSEHNMNRLAKFFVNKKNFDRVLVISMLVFLTINSILLILLFKWIFIKSPCAGEGVCQI